jgi:hypothetical protein
VNAAGVVTNPATASISLVGGTVSASPVLKLVITFPNANAEVFYFNGFAGTGGAFNAAAQKANLLAAVNVGSSSAPPSSRWTATSGASTLIAQQGVTFTASGGLDGATTITSTVLVGTDGVVGRTGMYALRGALSGSQFIFAGFFDTTQVATMVAFNRTEGTRCAVSFPIGTSTTGAQTLKAINSVSDPTLDACLDWDQMVDPWTGTLVYVAPAAKISGIIASLDFYQSPSNKPYLSAVGVLQTERSNNPVSNAEAAQRQASGFLYLTNPINRGAQWGLPFGVASDGVSNIADVRTANYIGLSLFQVLGPFVGEPQSQLANDPVRLAARGAVNQFMNTLLKPIIKISAYSNVLDTSNNTPTTIAQGFLVDNLAIQTLSGVKFILVNEQVGTGVQVTVKAA